MKKYTVILSAEAMMDTDDVYNYIANEIKQKETAYRYKAGLIHTIQKLSFYADTTGVNEYVQNMFGVDARRIIYKKTTIIFCIKDDHVYVKRVIASSMIH
jgi:hypothetical protein